jgi:hypothetical protein
MLHWQLRWSLWLSVAILLQVLIVKVDEGSGETGQTAARGDGAVLITLVANRLENPVFLTQAGDGSGRLVVVERPGRIRVVNESKSGNTYR